MGNPFHDESPCSPVIDVLADKAQTSPELHWLLNRKPSQNALEKLFLKAITSEDRLAIINQASKRHMLSEAFAHDVLSDAEEMAIIDGSVPHHVYAIIGRNTRNSDVRFAALRCLPCNTREWQEIAALATTLKEKLYIKRATSRGGVQSLSLAIFATAARGLGIDVSY